MSSSLSKPSCTSLLGNIACPIPVDIVLQSSDGILLGAHFEGLARFCREFPFQYTFTDDLDQVIELPETERVLQHLLRYTHFDHHDQSMLLSLDLQTLIDFAVAAETYGHWLALEECHSVLKRRVLTRPEETPEILHLTKNIPKLNDVIKSGIPKCTSPLDSVTCSIPVDVVLQSSDGKFLGAHMDNLARFCAGFPVPDSVTHQIYEVVPLTETEEVLKLLLRYTHIDRQDRQQLFDIDVQALMDFAVAADKYQHWLALKESRAVLRILAQTYSENAVQILQIAKDLPQLEDTIHSIVPQCVCAPGCTLAVDVILQSSDGSLLGAHMSTFAEFCTGFPLPDTVTHHLYDVVPLAERSAILRLLLKCCHADSHDLVDLRSIDVDTRTVMDLVEAADKYGNTNAMGKCLPALRRRASTSEEEALRVLPALHRLEDPKIDDFVRPTFKLSVENVMTALGGKPELFYTWALYKNQHTKAFEKFKAFVISIPSGLPPTAESAAKHFSDRVSMLKEFSYSPESVRRVRNDSTMGCAYNKALDEYMSKTERLAMYMKEYTWKKAEERVQSLLRALGNHEPVFLSDFEALMY
ncbi:hypothetical protein VNI00_016370 [Paramarasmius palmivorus]|uniref:BTB domain-containing protein n=1 Tax=Paramarasmius palmivorus TaxID=297713 RepID=A0AAW0BDZ6_9AGAR